jgi:hypothetical protein
MSFHFGSWLHGMRVWLSGKRPGKAVQHEGKRRRGGYNPTNAADAEMRFTTLVYGPACGNPPAGWVEYDGDHSVPANVGAMPAFFDFILQAGLAHTLLFTNSSLLEVHP